MFYLIIFFLFGHLDSVKTLRLPSTQINGLVNRSQRKKYSVKCSSQSSFSLTNKVGNKDDIINRNHKPLNKSTVALALQDGYASKSEEENTLPASFVQVLNKKFDALYRLTRPYTWASIVSCFIVITIYLYWNKVLFVLTQYNNNNNFLILSDCRGIISFYACSTKSYWFDCHVFHRSIEGKF